MGAGRAGAVVEVAADSVFVMMVMIVVVAVFMAVIVIMRMAVRAAVGVYMVVLVAMHVGVLALMHMLVDMRRPVGMRVRMAVRSSQRRAVVTVGMVVIVPVAVRMHRAVFMDMGVLVRICVHSALDLHFTCAAATNRTHFLSPDYSISISLTRISVPPVGCT
jgi:hypothetical protein